MKTKIISVFVIAFSLIACAVFAGDNKSAIKNNLSEKLCTGQIYYQIIVETIFQEADREKFEKAWQEMAAPFVISEIDYKLKSITVKMIRKASFDDVKQSFDKVGMRIMKETIVINK